MFLDWLFTFSYSESHFRTIISFHLSTFKNEFCVLFKIHFVFFFLNHSIKFVYESILSWMQNVCKRLQMFVWMNMLLQSVKSRNLWLYQVDYCKHLLRLTLEKNATKAFNFFYQFWSYLYDAWCYAEKSAEILGFNEKKVSFILVKIFGLWWSPENCKNFWICIQNKIGSRSDCWRKWSRKVEWLNGFSKMARSSCQINFSNSKCSCK